MAAYYRSFLALEPIKQLILSASSALQETPALPSQKPAPKALGIGVGAVIGIFAGAGMLIGGGFECAGCAGSALANATTDLGSAVGGGIGAGAAMATLPVVIGGAMGAWFVGFLNQRLLIEGEKALLQAVSRLQRAVLQELQDRQRRERRGDDDAYLFSLATKLNTAEHNLRADLTLKH